MKHIENADTLIYENKSKVEYQRSFIITLAGKLTMLLRDFNALAEQLDIKSRFELVDVGKIQGQSALSFIKMKILPLIQEEDLKIGGMKTTREHVFSLMDIPISAFSETYNDVCNFIAERQKFVGSNYSQDLLIEFNSDFFQVADDNVIVNTDTLEEWNDLHCRKYADTENKRMALELMKSIADSLNKLRDLQPKNPEINLTYNNLRSTHSSIILNSVKRLVRYNQDKNSLEVNNQGYITNF